MWVTLDPSQAHQPWAGDRCHRSGSRDTSICQQRVTEAGTVSDRKTDTENSSEPQRETYKVEFLGNEQLGFPLGIYRAGKKGRTGIIWRWHYKCGNKLSTHLGMGKLQGLGWESSSWVMPGFTSLPGCNRTGTSFMPQNKPFPSLSHPLETAHCATTDLLLKGSAHLGIWSSGNALRVLAKDEDTELCTCVWTFHIITSLIWRIPPPF